MLKSRHGQRKHLDGERSPRISTSEAEQGGRRADKLVSQGHDTLWISKTAQPDSSTEALESWRVVGRHSAA